MLTWLVYTFATTASATPLDCDLGKEKAAILALLIEADQAIADLDEYSLTDAVARARDTVRCLDEVLTPLEVAHLYRVSGISAYVADDLVRAVEDFAVAKAVDPNASIDTALGKPLRQTYEAVPPSTGEVIELPKPDQGYLNIDGARSDVAPKDRAYFAQWLNDDGSIRSSWFMGKGLLPPYPTRSSEKGDKGEKVGGGGKPGVPILVAGIAASLLSVGSMVGAEVTEDQFEGSKKRSEQLGGLITANRTLAYGGIGLGAAGIGLVGVSFAVGF